MSWKDSKIFVHFEISRLPRGLGSLRQQWHSIESDDHLPSDPDCNNTDDVTSFIRRTAHSEIPLVSDR